MAYDFSFRAWKSLATRFFHRINANLLVKDDKVEELQALTRAKALTNVPATTKPVPLIEATTSTKKATTLIKSKVPTKDATKPTTDQAPSTIAKVKFEAPTKA